ncbi:hypothetical protein GOP47_0010696 [Adiantum capillus-veneris]|uniref:Uncharacterized protein n=1 Tax=Adiantum capillus-veneris TaxID=13818 RepID=A0A9D4UVS5_ADICA|nr:hypothetical protein GOP47_0010696 [Adiantum capillus-veneris]
MWVEILRKLQNRAPSSQEGHGSKGFACNASVECSLVRERYRARAVWVARGQASGGVGLFRALFHVDEDSRVLHRAAAGRHGQHALSPVAFAYTERGRADATTTRGRADAAWEPRCNNLFLSEAQREGVFLLN